MKIEPRMDLAELSERMDANGDPVDPRHAQNMRELLNRDAPAYGWATTSDVEDADWFRMMDEAAPKAPAMQFDQARNADHTHTLHDGVVRYYVTAPGATPRAIATAFLAGYHQSGSPEPLAVTVDIGRLTPNHDEVAGELLAQFRGTPDSQPERVV